MLVDFWASWCAPCRADHPALRKVYNKMKDRNFIILSVSLDKYKEPWLNAINKDQLTWPQMSDLKYWQNEVARKYGINLLPSNFFIR